MKYGFDFSEEKNQLLKRARKISFEEIVLALKAGCLVDDIKHFNKLKYPNQRMLILKINDKYYVVPYVVDNKRYKVFLKTIYIKNKLVKIYGK